MSKKTRFTEEQKKSLRDQAKGEVLRLEKIFSDYKTEELLNRFKNTFNVCESAYKIILKEHQFQTKGVAEEHLKLDMRQVPYAMEFAGYSIDYGLLNRLFGANMKGVKTAKKLRDAITHSVDMKSVEEIKQRRNELFLDMKAFLDIIKDS